MFETITILDLATARARHAAARQSVVATNIANADTPGFRARDITPFEEIFARAGIPRDPGAAFRTRDAGGPASPNGNTVALEVEMLRSVEAQRDHSRALGVYRSTMNVLRASLGR